MASPTKYAAWKASPEMIKGGQWNKIQFDYQTPEVRNESRSAQVLCVEPEPEAGVCG